jgi:hypothetical protein
LGYARSTIHHAIITHPNTVSGRHLERNDDTGIATHIPELLLGAAQTGADEVVTVDSDPNDGDLGAPTSSHRYKMTQRTDVYQSAGAVGQS